MSQVDPIKNVTISELLARKLDESDGQADGKISKSVWEDFVKDKGGKSIENFIMLDRAEKSILTYALRNAKKNDMSADELAQFWLDSLMLKEKQAQSEASSNNQVKQDEKAGITQTLSETLVPAETSLVFENQDNNLLSPVLAHLETNETAFELSTEDILNLTEQHRTLQNLLKDFSMKEYSDQSWYSQNRLGVKTVDGEIVEEYSKKLEGFDFYVYVDNSAFNVGKKFINAISDSEGRPIINIERNNPDHSIKEYNMHYYNSDNTEIQVYYDKDGNPLRGFFSKVDIDGKRVTEQLSQESLLDFSSKISKI